MFLGVSSLCGGSPPDLHTSGASRLAQVLLLDLVFVYLSLFWAWVKQHAMAGDWLRVY